MKNDQVLIICMYPIIPIELLALCPSIINPILVELPVEYQQSFNSMKYHNHIPIYSHIPTCLQRNSHKANDIKLPHCPTWFSQGTSVLEVPNTTQSKSVVLKKNRKFGGWGPCLNPFAGLQQIRIKCTLVCLLCFWGGWLQFCRWRWLNWPTQDNGPFSTTTTTEIVILVIVLLWDRWIHDHVEPFLRHTS